MEVAELPANSACDSGGSGDELVVSSEKERGIMYISRIPPKMTPQRIRQLLEVHGPIGRIFLAPKKNDKKSLKKKRNKKEFGQLGFDEGWVEFVRKRDAKAATEMLNCTSIGQLKGKAFYDDLWNIKYLPKFTWSHLTDQLAYERAVREQKLRAEIAQARKINQFYLRQSEKAKEMEIIEKKRKAKHEKNGTLQEEDPYTVTMERIQKKFKQRKSIITSEEDSHTY